MINVVIANVIDFIASMVQIYSGTVKEKGKILILQILQLGLQTISMILLGAITGAISNVLSCIRNYLCYKNIFTWPIKIILIVLSLILTVLFNNQGWLGYLPFVVCTIYVLFMDIKDEFKFKVLVTLTFTVKNSASVGETSDVIVTYNNGEICNFDEEDVNFDIASGKVTVK